MMAIAPSSIETPREHQSPAPPYRAALYRSILRQGQVVTGSININPAEFHELMLTVDHILVSLGVGIQQRPMRALRELSRRYSLTLPVTEPPPGSGFDGAECWPLTARVYEWYEKRYGDRLKVDLAPGRLAILIEDDLWILRLPRIYGSAQLTASRTLLSSRSPSSTDLVYNVVDAIEGMPKSRASSLPDNQLEHIFEKFILGIQAFGFLEGSVSCHELIGLAVADIGAAVDHLTAPQAQHGLSKWSSLQATEKLLKAAISLAGERFSNIHDLEKLTKQATARGLIDRWSMLTPHIQCSPGIRYGEEACDRDAALRAHHASLAMVPLLQEGGAKFKSNLAL